MKYLFCVLLALSLAACGKETEDPGLSREEFLDLFPLHEHGEVYVEPFYVRFYYPGGNCLLFPTDMRPSRVRRSGSASASGASCGACSGSIGTMENCIRVSNFSNCRTACALERFWTNAESGGLRFFCGNILQNKNFGLSLHSQKAPNGVADNILRK